MVQMALQEIVYDGLINKKGEEENDHENSFTQQQQQQPEETNEKWEIDVESSKFSSSDTLDSSCTTNDNDLDENVDCLLLNNEEIVENGCQTIDSLDNNKTIMAQENYIKVEEAKPVSPKDSEDVIQSNEHDCLKHPTHLTLLNKLEASKNTISNLEENIQRIEKQLAEEINKTLLIPQLEQNIQQLKKEIELCQQEHDLDQRNVAMLKKELETKLTSIKKQYETANKEKENMVMRYAISEKELLDCKKHKENLDKKLKEISKENELLQAKIKTLTNEKIKLSQQYENKSTEVSNAYKEIDKLKEEINSRDIKIKWTQNKLKSEMDIHKECPIAIEKLNSKLKILENEIDNCRQELKSLNLELKESINIEKENEEKFSKFNLENSDKDCKEKESEYDSNTSEVSVQNSPLIDYKLELGNKNNLLDLINDTKSLFSEINHLHQLSEHFRSLDEAKASQELISINNVDFKTVSETESNQSLTSNLRIRIEDLERQLAEEKNNEEFIERTEKMLAELNQLRNTNEELLTDVTESKAREAELLSFTQQLTTKNVELQSEFSAVESKANELELIEKKQALREKQLQEELEHLQSNLIEEQQRRAEETRLLARQVAEKTAKADTLTETVNTLQSELSLVRNKHTVQIKELQRELSQYKRKIDQMEATSVCPTISGSTTTNSLTSGGSKSSNSSLSSLNDSPVLQGVDLPPHVLIDRIVKLQQDIARQNDRIEFLEEHSTQLVKELQKKTKLLQNYILREQTGALTSNSMDRTKAELAAKSGGIMASLYGGSTKSPDETMTFELCLEINRKLQAVLEDTLLKNITLKENIDTLGDEIARLSKN